MSENKLAEGGAEQKQSIIDKSIVDKFLAEDSDGYTDTWRKSRTGNIQEDLVLMQLFEGKTSYDLKFAPREYSNPEKPLSNVIPPTREQYTEAMEVAESYLSGIRERKDVGAADLVERLVLIPDEIVRYAYDEHYGVFMEFRPDGTTLVEDEGKRYEVARDENLDSSIGDYIKNVRSVQAKIIKLLPHIPSGNLGATAGIKPLIEAFLKVEVFSGYYPTEKENKSE